MVRLIAAIVPALVLVFALSGSATADHTQQSSSGQTVRLEHSGTTVTFTVTSPSGAIIPARAADITATNVQTGRVFFVESDLSITLPVGTYTIQLHIHKIGLGSFRHSNETVTFENVTVGGGSSAPAGQGGGAGGAGGAGGGQ